MAALQPQLPAWAHSQPLYGNNTHRPYATCFFLKQGINGAGTERWLLELEPNTGTHPGARFVSAPTGATFCCVQKHCLCPVPRSPGSAILLCSPLTDFPLAFSAPSCLADDLAGVLWISQVHHSCLFPLPDLAPLFTSASSALNLFPPQSSSNTFLSHLPFKLISLPGS